MQERHNYIANALELHLSCTNPSILKFILICFVISAIGPFVKMAEISQAALAVLLNLSLWTKCFSKKFPARFFWIVCGHRIGYLSAGTQLLLKVQLSGYPNLATPLAQGAPFDSRDSWPTFEKIVNLEKPCRYHLYLSITKWIKGYSAPASKKHVKYPSKLMRTCSAY